MDPNLECITHWGKAGWWSDTDLDILVTRLKGEIQKRDFESTESLSWKYSGIMDSMVYALFAITSIMADSAY